MKNSQRATWLAGTMLAAFCTTTSAFAQTRSFDIPAEDAVKAIPEFARQAGIQIVAPADKLKGVQTPAISGPLDLHAALDKLLAGTGIEIASDDGQTIILRTHQKNAEAASGEEAASIETVTVTGTHLRGGAAQASPVITIDRSAIVNSGFASTGEVIHSLPQNFSGGVNPGTGGTLGESSNNISDASSADLRGLGSESTLVLVNGHRLASDGFVGGIVDISAIPLSAVDRVEVLTDGASAIYGSDAVGGVVNFVLRKDFDGAETSGQIGTSTQGGATQYQGSQLAGMDWGSGGGLVNYEYFRQNDLLAQDRKFATAAANPLTLTPEQDRSSLFGTVHQDVGDGVTLFAEGLYTFRTDTSFETIPGVLSIFERSRSQVYGVNAGVDWQIDDNWHANVTGTVSYDHSHIDERENATNGAILDGESFDNAMDGVEGLLNGDLFDLPSGPVAVALGAGYRAELYRDSGSTGGFTRNVAYVFGEAHVPLVTPSEDRVGLERLDASLAGRFEHYSDFGSTTNPKVGLVYVPVSGLSLRSTWGTSFRAPGLDIEDGLRQLYVYPAALYAGAPAGSQVMLTYGANPKLTPEKSTTWTVGADVNPDMLPDLKLGITLFGIGYRDRIITPVPNRSIALVTPADAPFVLLNPSASEQAMLVANSNYFQDYSAGSASGAYDPSKVYAVIFNQYQNVSSENASGVDLTGTYHVASDIGGFDLFGNGSWLRLAERAVAGAPTQILSGTIFNPSVFKARAGVTWTEDDWAVTAIVNNVAGETDASSGSPVHVPSWTTADVQIGYTAADWTGPLQGLRFGLSVHNLFDTDPPELNSTGFQAPYFSSGYDSTNTSPLGRFISFAITKDW